jgi:hypothetical protein
MLKLEQVALELLEYKLGDIQSQRQVRGGISSAWELYHFLAKEIALVPDADRKRIDAAGRALRMLSETPKKPRRVLDTFEALIIDDLAPTEAEAPAISLDADRAATPDMPDIQVDAEPIIETDPEVHEEQQVLQRLARQVWWSEMDSVIQELAVQCRAEKDRATARLLYALSRNLEVYAKTTQFASDINLSRFKVSEPVPERGDPLISLNSLDTLSDLIREVIEITMTLGTERSTFGRLDLMPDQNIAYMRRFALAVARDPYAGELSVIERKGPSSEQLRLAIQELLKEPMREEQRQVQRRQLEERLRLTLAHERQQREAFQQDVKLFTEAVNTFFDRLERYLPARVGGEAGEPQLRGGVLFAVNPALQLKAVPREATAVTVHLKGPVRFVLDGIELAITGSGRAQFLFVAGKEHALQPRMRIRTGHKSLLAIMEGQYLYLQVKTEVQPLASTLAEALAVLYVLKSDHKDELLLALRTAANVTVAEPQELVMQALSRLAEMSARAPSRRQALEGLIRGAAKARRIVLSDNVIMGLVQRLYTAMTATADDLETVLAASDATESVVQPLSEEPLNVTLGGQPLTIRKYSRRGSELGDSVVVMLPGRVLGSFTTHLVQPFPSGALVCVRAEEEIACLYFAQVVLSK